MNKITVAELSDELKNNILKALDLDATSEIEKMSYDQYGLDSYEIDGMEYILANDDKEADDACEQYIKDSLWAFNADFIEFYADDDVTSFDVDDISVEGINEEDFEDEDEYLEALDEARDKVVGKIFDKYRKNEALSEFWEHFIIGGIDFVKALQKVQEEYSEGANDFVEDLINNGKGMDKFVNGAISADGRGHFLSGYDGEEVEGDDGIYLYRTN